MSCEVGNESKLNKPNEIRLHPCRSARPQTVAEKPMTLPPHFCRVQFPIFPATKGSAAASQGGDGKSSGEEQCLPNSSDLKKSNRLGAPTKGRLTPLASHLETGCSQRAQSRAASVGRPPAGPPEPLCCSPEDRRCSVPSSRLEVGWDSRRTRAAHWPSPFAHSIAVAGTTNVNSFKDLETQTKLVQAGTRQLRGGSAAGKAAHRDTGPGGRVAMSPGRPPESTRSSESSTHRFPLGTDPPSPSHAVRAGGPAPHQEKACDRGRTPPHPHGRHTGYKQVTQLREAPSQGFYWNK